MFKLQLPHLDKVKAKLHEKIEKLKQLKWKRFLLLIGTVSLCLVLFCGLTYATPVSQQYTETQQTFVTATQLAEETIETTTLQPSELEGAVSSQLDKLDLDSLAKITDSKKDTNPYLTKFSIKDLFMKVTTGKLNISFENIGNYLLKILTCGLKSAFKSALIILVIMLLSEILKSLTNVLQNKNTQKFIDFVIISTLAFNILELFTEVTTLSTNILGDIQDVLKVVTPTLSMFMMSSGFSISATTLLTTLLGGTALFNKIILKYIFPIISSILVAKCVLTLSDYTLDKMFELVTTTIRKVLKGAFVSLIGILSLYKATVPYVDHTLKKGTLQILTSLIPFVGDAVEGGVNVVLNISFLIRNSYLVVAIIILILLSCIPLINIFSYSVVYQLLGALAQVMGNKIVSETSTSLGKSCELVLACTTMVLVLCIMGFVICTGVGAGIC